MSKWRERWRRASPYVTPSVVFGVIVLALFWRVWTGIDGARQILAWDSLWEYWGDLQFQLDSYAAGELPLWNPHDRAGYPFHADPQAGILYPVNWVLLAMATITGPEQWLMAFKAMFHFWFAGIGMYVFLRRRGNPAASCYVGGIFYLLTYPFSTYMFSALIWGMAWLPWVMIAIDRWAEKPTWGRGAGVALTMAICQLAGAPGAFWYVLLVVVPYGTWAVVHHAMAAENRRDYLRIAGLTTAAAGALFVAMVAAQLLATTGLVGHTVRDARNLNFIGTTAFTADDLFGMLVPRMPGEGAYIGFISVFWIGAMLTINLSARSMVLAGTAVFGVLLAWGNLGPFLPLSASALEPFGFFRRAHRYFLVTMPALAILSAEGLTAMSRLDSDELRKRVKWIVLGVGALGVLIFGIATTVSATKPNRPEPFRDAYALAFAAVVVATWATYMLVSRGGSAKWRKVFLAVCAVVLFCDLWYARSPIMDRNFCDRRAKEFTSNRHCPWPPGPRDKVVKGLPGVPLEARVYDRAYARYRPGIRLRIRDLGGYEGDPLGLRRFTKMRNMVKRYPRLLGHANIRYLLEAGREKLRKSGADRRAMKAVRPGVWKLTDVAPAVMWIGKPTLVAGNEDAVFRQLQKSKPGTVALLELNKLSTSQVAAAKAGSEGKPVAGALIKFKRNSLTAEIEAPGPGIVVIHESYYPGWTATVDGSSADIVVVNGLFRGVFVSGGKHTIVMRYKATRYVVLMFLSILTMLGCVFLMGREWWSLRRAGVSVIADSSTSSTGSTAETSEKDPPPVAVAEHTGDSDEDESQEEQREVGTPATGPESPDDGVLSGGDDDTA